MSVRSEGGGSPRLVVVLEKSRQLVLEVEPREKMLSDRPRVTLAQAIVEPLVVRVVETLLLQRPLQVPVHLGHETETRNHLTDVPDRSRPE